MCSGRVTSSTHDRQDVDHQLNTARRLGQWRQVQYGLAILAVMDGQSVAEVAWVLPVHAQTGAAWGRVFCCDGIQGAPRQTPTGRPPKRTPTPPEALAQLLDAGPVQAGFSGACWRSPMIQPMLDDRVGVFSSVVSSAQWLRNLGLSYQQAAFGSDPLDAGKRHAWGTTTWPPMLRLANARQAVRRFGAAAAVPPWGTRTSTWARRGQQPKVKTSGQRTG